MDRREEKQDWSWLPSKMPAVVAMVKEKREAYGNRHVDECWRRGVVDGEPGWFFAREGALAIGTPTAMCDDIEAMAPPGCKRQPMLMLREPQARAG